MGKSNIETMEKNDNTEVDTLNWRSKLLKILEVRRKSISVFLMSICIVYFILALVNYIHFELGFTLGISYASFFEWTLKAQTLILGVGSFLLLLFLSIYFLMIMEKYERNKINFNAHTISGILGVFIFFITVGLLLTSHFFGFNIYIYCFWLLFLSALFCLYCSCAWFYIKISPKFKEPMIGNFISSILILGVLSYFINGFSSMIVNDIFTVNSKYFPFTQTLVSIMIASPILALTSLIIIILVIVIMFRSDWSKSDYFFNINVLISAYLTLSASLLLMTFSDNLINWVSTNFDFDSRSPCEFTEEYNGYIVLDPGHTKVLVYDQKGIRQYKIKTCTY